MQEGKDVARDVGHSRWECREKGGTKANDTKNRQGVMGYIPGTRWDKAECKAGLVEVSLSVYS